MPEGFSVYAHKQQPINMTESPQSNLSFSSNGNFNEGVSSRSVVGLGFATARIIPASKQIFNTFVNSSGDKLLQKRVRQASNLVAFGAEVYTLGFVGAVAVEGIKTGVSIIANNRQNTIDTINQEYERQKNGVKVDKFVGVGERID